MAQYKYEYIDFTYAEEGQSKLDSRGDDGWEVAGSTLAHPYLFVLWQKGGSSKDASSDHGSTSAVSPGA